MSDTVLPDSGSDEESRPSPPKRGRGRGRGRKNGRAAARATRPRSSRTSALQNRHQQQTVINVGDIDSDEEDRPRACSPVPRIGNARAISPIGINILAEALGITDWTPNKTSLSNTSQDTDSLKVSTSNPENIANQPSNTTQASRSTFQLQSQTGPQTSNNNQVDGTVAPALKKTSRRGLAKKDAGLSSTALEGFNLRLPDTAVYSHCVPSGLASAFHEGKMQSQATPVTDFSSITDTQSLSESEELRRAEATGSVTVKSDRSSPQIERVTKCEKAVEDKGEATGTEIHEVLDEEDSILELRSPSPPPQPKAQQKGTARRKKINQKVSNALQTINNVKGRLKKLGQVTPKLKTRGRQSDVMIVNEEEGIVKKDMVVKVRYLSTVHRVSMNLDETLHSLISRLCALLGDVEEHELSLFLADQLLELSLSIRSVNLSVADILDCHHIKPSATECINLVVQCHHSRNKTTLVAHKHEPLQALLRDYSNKMGFNPKCVQLLFDGEHVDPRDTPTKLDMEDGDVVDVIVN